jgi:hypothetical protein
MSTIDITPSPRILRTLGEIPFQPWQCIAELADNSLWMRSQRHLMQVSSWLKKEFSITWSGDSVAHSLVSLKLRIQAGNGSRTNPERCSCGRF